MTCEWTKINARTQLILTNNGKALAVMSECSRNRFDHKWAGINYGLWVDKDIYIHTYIYDQWKDKGHLELMLLIYHLLAGISSLIHSSILQIILLYWCKTLFFPFANSQIELAVSSRPWFIHRQDITLLEQMLTLRNCGLQLFLGMLISWKCMVSFW